MYLRKLSLKDASRMLDWMHDKTVVEHLGANFAEKTLKDCEAFITGSLNDPHHLHLAIANDEDAYMGTVSLKHIDLMRKTAEFAITVRADAMGKGYSRFGMHEILNRGISELGLVEIFWCVSPNNERAVRFYDKCGYRRTKNVPKHILEAYPYDMQLFWYVYTGEQINK